MRQIDIFTLTERQLDAEELDQHIGEKVRLIGANKLDEMTVKIRRAERSDSGVFVTLEHKDMERFNFWIHYGQPTHLWIRNARKE